MRVKFAEGGEELERSLCSREVHTHDAELAKDLSVFGEGFELVYAGADGKPKLALIDPRQAFVVMGEGFEGGVTYGVIYGGRSDGGGGNIARVYGRTDVRVFEEDVKSGKWVLVSSFENLLGVVPVVRFLNNEEGMGDFEHVITLIDAYNTLQSDRVNDKERFVDSILLIQGCQFPDEESASKMLANRILELPFEGADAKYLTKTMNEAETEILKRALAGDIHKFSQTPDFSDENFSGNSSGVAIKYKLLSIENLAKIKERFFTAGVCERVGLVERILRLLGRIGAETPRFRVGYDRTLPVNELETAQIIETLDGIVPGEELLERWRR